MVTRALAVLVLAAAVGCATQDTSNSGSTGGGFGDEGSASSDPGPTQRSATRTSSAGAADFQTVYFAFDDYGLSDPARRSLRHNAEILRANPGMRVQIEGNCDERGSDEYNLALGKKRAEAAKRYLSDLGIDAGRISTLSYGEENPAVRGSNEMAWRQNRRDDFKTR